MVRPLYVFPCPPVFSRAMGSVLQKHQDLAVRGQLPLGRAAQSHEFWFAPMGLQLAVVKPCPRAEHLGDFCTSLCKNQLCSFLHAHHFCQQSP